MATRTKDVTAQVNGVAVLFTVPETYDPLSLEVFFNGVRLRKGVEFVETPPNKFTWLATAKLPAPAVGDTVQVQYEVGTASDVLVVASGIDPTI